MAWSSLWSSFVCSWPLLFAIFLPDRQQETATHCVHIQLGSLPPCTFALRYRSLNKRQDLYLIASLWFVAQVRARLTILALASVTSSTHPDGRKARLNAALHSKLYFKRKRGERVKARVGVAARPGASASYGSSFAPSNHNTCTDCDFEHTLHWWTGIKTPLH